MLERASLINLLLARLERISVDSPLAHRASGIRGALLRAMEERSMGEGSATLDADHAIAAALDILRQAAAELRRSRRDPA